MRSDLAAIVAAASLASAQSPARTPENVIVFIADGCGANSHRAFEMWRGEPAIYRGEGWFQGSAATFALRSSSRPPEGEALSQDPRLVYDPAAAWDTTRVEGSSAGYPFRFAGYRWLLSTAPDSANTASAIFSGVSTYKGSINIDGAGNPIRTTAEAASARGMSVGIVTSVPFTHATPAAAGAAHVPHRDMFHEIAHQMLTEGVCDVIAGAGHPEYDDNALARTESAYTFIGREDWLALRDGSLSDGSGASWTLVEDADRIASLASGEVPLPLLILPRVGQTLQQQRTPRDLARAAAPGELPLNPEMPTLREMALAALNGVDDDPDGFFLLVEGGAVDWAMHDNQLGRVIEEMADFHGTIEAVCEILDSGERGYDWTNTLVVVTADHDHLLLGPDSDTVPFQPLADNGPGRVPGHRWHYNSHSNQPVPVFVRGAGVERFEAIPTEPDTAPEGVPEGMRRPPYFHQREIGRALQEFVAARGAGAPSGGGASR